MWCSGVCCVRSFRYVVEEKKQDPTVISPPRLCLAALTVWRCAQVQTIRGTALHYATTLPILLYLLSKGEYSVFLKTSAVLM